DLFAPKPGTWLGQKEEKARSRLLPSAAAGVALVVLLATFLLGASHGAAPIGALQAENARLQAQVVVLQREVTLLRQQWGHCTPYTDDFQTIKRLMAQGHFASAAQVANLDLSQHSTPNARPCDPIALAQLWYSASIDALLSAPP